MYCGPRILFARGMESAKRGCALGSALDFSGPGIVVQGYGFRDNPGCSSGSELSYSPCG